MLASYALIGNGATVGIISPKGSLDWLCCPDADFSSHFSSLLDERSGGRFSIRPKGPFESSQSYLGRDGRSAVLETRFSTSSGRGRVVDWMPWQTSPVVLRQVETLEGAICWELFCLPRFHYGQVQVVPERILRGICFRAPALQEEGRLAGTQPVQLDAMLGAAISRFELSAGEQRRFSWSWGRGGQRTEDLLDSGPEACLAEWDDWLHRCEANAENGCCPSDARWKALTLRSEVVLRLLTHPGTGAIIESPTTSMPRVPHGTQNWDLRYCWLRHAPDVLAAWIQLGHRREARRLTTWLSDIVMATPAHEILPAYSLDGAPVPEEHELHALRGHEGARPVRIGNSAARQFQLDSVPALLESFDLASRQEPLPPDSPLWKRIEELMGVACQLWRRPDHGIWDLRFRPEHYLSSKISCWKGITSAIRLSESHARSVPQRWREEARRLRETILREGFHPERQVYTQAFGEGELDSSALLIGLSGLQHWTDPEVLSTLIVLESELREGALLRRSRNSHASPDIDGAHVLSSLWWAASLVEVGRADQGAEVLGELARLVGPLGYLPEGFDLAAGTPIGNFPSSRAHAFALPVFQAASRALERSRRVRRAA